MSSRDRQGKRAPMMSVPENYERASPATPDVPFLPLSVRDEARGLLVLFVPFRIPRETCRFA